MNSNFYGRSLRRLGIMIAIVVTPLALTAAVLVAYQSAADASSHREAPSISKDAFADNTDTYVFIPRGQTQNIVLAASWIPFEGPEGGPNYFEWDDNVLYDIYVSNDGDASPEFTYTLSSRVAVANPNTFLYNVDTIGAPNDADWNRRQYITVTETSGGVEKVLVGNKLTAPVNIGSKSTPNYESALADMAIHTYTEGPQTLKIFGGQTDDAFWVDLQVFDLLTLRGQAPPVGYTVGNNIPVDSVAGFNAHSLVIEIPISRLKQGGETVLGVWATSRRPSTWFLAADGQAANAVSYQQVSRLGMPLVNEVVLPLGLKDTFNTLRPEQDLSVYALLQQSVEDPELGTLLCTLYSVPLPKDADDNCHTEYTPGTPRTGRGDIFDIFLRGMVLTDTFTIRTQSGNVNLPVGYNINRPSGVVPAEMIRINTAISGTLCAPAASVNNPFNRMGVFDGDACGFPNGRRLTDDIVEIELAAVAGAAYQILDGTEAGFLFNNALLGVLSDNVNENDRPFRTVFPYMATAQSGQEHYHDNPILAICLPLIMKAAGVFQGAPGDLLAHPASVVFLTALVGFPALVWMRRRRSE